MQDGQHLLKKNIIKGKILNFSSFVSDLGDFLKIACKTSHFKLC